MNIVVIANGYPTKQDPQYGCFEKEQAIALSKLGHKVSILYVDGRFRTYRRKFGITRTVDNDIEIYGLYYFPTFFLNKISNQLQYWVRKKMLLKVFKQYLKTHLLPDIVYAHFLYNISCAVYLKEKYHIPLVGMEHWSALNKEKLSAFVIYRGNIAYQGADRIIAVSESLKQQIYKHFQKDSVVVHNMIAEEFATFQVSSREINNNLELITIGSLLKVKGFDILIDAMQEVVKQCPSVMLKIIGDGVERTKLEKMISLYGLTEHVKLLGRKSKEEIIFLLKNSDVFISSSRSENFSVAILEALSVGLPVVATSCGGSKECIDFSNGVLVPVEDSQALAQGIVKVCHDLNQYDKYKISEACKARFAPSVIARQVINVFDQVISRE